LEGFDGRIEPFNELIHFIRPHKGQITTASRVKEFLEGSEIEQEKIHVQDPIHFVAFHKFMALDALITSKKSLRRKCSVTDNPNIFISDKLSPEVIFTANHWHWHWTF
jgi:histidine ammonia-lyase